MLISYWSSDVCSSDLRQLLVGHRLRDGDRGLERPDGRRARAVDALHQFDIILFDEIEREIALHRHRHLGEQVLRPLARIEERVLAQHLGLRRVDAVRSAEHTSELQSLMRTSYAA